MADHLDKDKAVQCFLEHLESIHRLPLITDSEMAELFGEEVAAALAGLKYRNNKEGTCLNCTGRCCLAANCELYAPQFSRCPIQDLRPPLCRLHFCNRFAAEDDFLIKELGDIFLDSLLAAESLGSGKVRLFDSPPLRRNAPSLVAAISPWVNAVRESSLDADYAMCLIQHEAGKYRTPVPDN